MGHFTPKMRDCTLKFHIEIENGGNAVLQGEVLNSYIGMLMNSLKDEPRVAYQACYALHELAAVWANDERYEETYPLSPAFGPMIQVRKSHTPPQLDRQGGLRQIA